jgi:hypothetical protein
MDCRFHGVGEASRGLGDVYPRQLSCGPFYSVALHPHAVAIWPGTPDCHPDWIYDLGDLLGYSHVGPCAARAFSERAAILGHRRGSGQWESGGLTRCVGVPG